MKGNTFMRKIGVYTNFVDAHYQETINAVAAQDIPIVMGQTVILSALYIAVVFLTDILYTIVDPRIRITGGKR